MERWRELQAGEHFNQQILCDPTPSSDRSLPSDQLQVIDKAFLPKNLMKFMLIDPAGDQATQAGKDSWALGVFGVDRDTDEIGASNIYILDLVIDKFNHSEAIEEAVRMYMRNGVIQTLGIEKVGQSTAEIHVANSLKAQNRRISIENKSLTILKPEGRAKADRIIAAIQWPLNNGKWFYSDNVLPASITRLKTEMDRFPFWHDDGLDICAYVYDILRNYRFSRVHKLEPLPYVNVGVV
jgi:hypothetical protein